VQRRRRQSTFSFPKSRVATAKGPHKPGLKHHCVDDLAQTLRDLRALRGSRPQPSPAPVAIFLKADAVVWKEWTIARILSSTRQCSAEIARMNFTTLRKGLRPQRGSHPAGVDRRAEMGHLEARIRELQDQLSECPAPGRANPTFDEATLAGALGAQSAAILRSAHEEAGRVTPRPRSEAPKSSPRPSSAVRAHLIEAQEASRGADWRGREHRRSD